MRYGTSSDAALQLCSSAALQEDGAELQSKQRAVYGDDEAAREGAGKAAFRLLRANRYTLLDPKLAVEPIYGVPGASKAHLDVVNGPIP